jgi:protein-L-isoaspartate(D-aspartate) O-methyltransferase
MPSAGLAEDIVQETWVEVDPQLAASARANLAAGYHLVLVRGDPADGSPAATPYDRVLATVAATRIRYAWVSQARPRGRLVVPAHGALTRRGLTALTAGGDGAASGHYLPHAGGFFSLRAQRHPELRLLHQAFDAHAGQTQRVSRSGRGIS